MAARIVLVGLPAEDAAAVRQGLPTSVEAEVEEVGPLDGLGALADEPGSLGAVVLWDPGAGGGIAFAQRIARIDRDVPIFIVAPPERLDAVRRAVQVAPFVGGQVTAHSSAAVGALGPQIAAAAKRVRGPDPSTTEAATPPPGYAEHVLRHAPIGIVTLDGERIVRALNPQAARMLAVDGDAAVGSSLRALVPEDYDAEVRALIESAEAGGAARTVLELPGSRFLEVSVSRYLGPGDEPATLMILGDVTDRERGALRLEHLQAVTDAALGSLDLDQTLDELMTRIRAALEVDAVAVVLLDESGRELRVRASQGLDAHIADVAIPLGEGFSGRIAVDRRPLRIETVAPTDVVDAAYPMSPGSLLGVPLIVAGSLIGVLHVGSTTSRAFTDDDEALLSLVGHRVALAINQARMYAHEHQTAEVLQRSLLPQRLPEVPGLELAATYLPGGPEIEVGGDWYDVSALDGGRVTFSIGDVVGRGLDAAAVMGHLRAALRAYAIEGHPPGAALQRLNELVTHGARTLATAVHMSWEPDGRLRVACAGHPPPLVVGPDGDVTLIDEPRGPALGILPFATYEEAEVELLPGARVVLYTDGLIERRSESIDVSLERLKEVARDAPDGAQALADHLLEGLLEGHGADDVALLVVEAPRVGQRLELEVSVAPESLGVVRTHLRRWLSEHGVAADVAQDVVVASGEAVTNVIEHAYGPGHATVRVEAEMRAGTATVTVRDHGRWRDQRDLNRGRGTPMMEALMDEVTIDTGADGTVVRLSRVVNPKASEEAA
jgi:PAS domain S-box-containing protein